jgi:hypothetical protein
LESWFSRSLIWSFETLKNLVENNLSKRIQALSALKHLEYNLQEDGALRVVDSDVWLRSFHTFRGDIEQHLNCGLIIYELLFAIDHVIV